MAVRSDTRDLDSFMATMVAQSIPLPIERAVALARERFGLDARVLSDTTSTLSACPTASTTSSPDRPATEEDK